MSFKKFVSELKRRDVHLVYEGGPCVQMFYGDEYGECIADEAFSDLVDAMEHYEDVIVALLIRTDLYAREWYRRNDPLDKMRTCPSLQDMVGNLCNWCGAPRSEHIPMPLHERQELDEQIRQETEAREKGYCVWCYVKPAVPGSSHPILCKECGENATAQEQEFR